MTIAFYFASGSPYAWRTWLALEHKQVPYELKMMSFDAGDLEKPAYLAINPRHRVPAIVDDGFALYESAAILDYLEEQYPKSGQRLFPADVKARATARRLIREGDQYLAATMEKLADEVLFTPLEKHDEEAIAEARRAYAAELELFERYAPRDGFFAGEVGAVDFTLYPIIAFTLRLERRKKDLAIRPLLPPRISAWMKRVEQLPYHDKTYPPHWKQG